MTKKIFLYLAYGLSFNLFAEEIIGEKCLLEKSQPALASLEQEMAKIKAKEGGGPPDIAIRSVDYPRNANADYCLRSMLIADTIVFHHSASLETDTAETINSYHLQRGSEGKPWHMIGYHYTINAPYQDSAGSKRPQVTEARPLEMTGAHAGSDAFGAKVSAEQKALIEKTGITCGKIGEKFEPKKDIFNALGQTKINNTSVGIVFIGNYSPFDINNPSGYPANNARYPTFSSLEIAGRLICHLQRNNPGLKYITFHGKFRQTACPGLVKERLAIIKNIAEKYGCTFNM